MVKCWGVITGADGGGGGGTALLGEGEEVVLHYWEEGEGVVLHYWEEGEGVRLEWVKPDQGEEGEELQQAHQPYLFHPLL